MFGLRPRGALEYYSSASPVFVKNRCRLKHRSRRCSLRGSRRSLGPSRSEDGLCQDVRSRGKEAWAYMWHCRRGHWVLGDRLLMKCVFTHLHQLIRAGPRGPQVCLEGLRRVSRPRLREVALLVARTMGRAGRRRERRKTVWPYDLTAV